MFSKKANKIIFLGDSLTESCEWSGFWPQLSIQNFAISGDRTDGVLDLLEYVISKRPQKLFIMIGINDLWQGRPVEKIILNHQKILETLSSRLPRTKVRVMSILPINVDMFKAGKILNEDIKKLNGYLASASLKFKFKYFDLFRVFENSNGELDPKFTTDGVHLTAVAYKTWKNTIEQDVLD